MGEWAVLISQILRAIGFELYVLYQRREKTFILIPSDIAAQTVTHEANFPVSRRLLASIIPTELVLFRAVPFSPSSLTHRSFYNHVDPRRMNRIDQSQADTRCRNKEPLRHNTGSGLLVVWSGFCRWIGTLEGTAGGYIIQFISTLVSAEEYIDGLDGGFAPAPGPQPAVPFFRVPSQN